MKAIVLLVASACLINGLAAYSFNFPLEDETLDIGEKSLEMDDHLEIFYPDRHDTENMIVPFPTDDPNEASTVTITTTRRPTTITTIKPTTTTRRPTTTTTRRPLPTWRPTTSRPTTTTTRRPLPTWRPTTSRPTTTTTRRPRPTWRPTTSRPTTTSRPGRRNPQIYNNAVRSLGPFAGRLVNVVLNKQGAQKTVQENDILYNLNSILKRRLSDNEEEIEN